MMKLNKDQQQFILWPLGLIGLMIICGLACSLFDVSEAQAQSQSTAPALERIARELSEIKTEIRKANGKSCCCQ